MPRRTMVWPEALHKSALDNPCRDPEMRCAAPTTSVGTALATAPDAPRRRAAQTGSTRHDAGTGAGRGSRPAMQIEIRSTDRLRGPKALDLGPILEALGDAARDGSLDLERVRVMCDWVQYKQNFRGPVDVRRIEPHTLEAVGA